VARGTMHAPKPDGQRRRRNAPTHDAISLTRDDVLRGEDLATLTGRADWSASTLAWFETWRRSPQAQVFEATDWSRLALLAPIVEQHFRRPSAAALGEIRMNEERLGATVVDRVRARMRIEAEETEAAEVVQLRTVAQADVAARLRGE
jgi:hypothetical protein